MTGSAFHKAMAQDAAQLMQVTGTKGWVAGLSKALQTANYAFQPQQLQSIDIGQLQTLLRGGRQRIWDDLEIFSSHSSFAGCQEMHICMVVQGAILPGLAARLGCQDGLASPR